MVMEDYKDKNVLIVTHAGNVKAINYYFIGKPKDFDFTKKPSSKTADCLHLRIQRSKIASCSALRGKATPQKHLSLRRSL